MKTNLSKKCSNFKAISSEGSVYDNNLTKNCMNCVYFSSKNCHKDILDEIPYEVDFI